MTTVLGTTYLTLLLFSTMTALALAWVTWVRRAQAGAVPMLLLCLGLALLAVSNAMEALAPTLAAKETWVNIQYLGYGLGPVCYFLLVTQYMGLAHWSKPRPVLLLLCMPALTLLLTWTNASHHLMRHHQHLEFVSELSFLGKTAGPWWWVHVLYSLLLMVASIVMLVRASQQSLRGYRDYLSLLLVGLLIPIVSSILYICRVSPSPNMDFTPAVSVFSTILICISVLRLRLFDIAPIAFSHVIESMRDGMLVLDGHDRVAHVNAAFAEQFSLNSRAIIGQSVTQILAEYDVVRRMLTGDILEGNFEFMLPGQDGERYWEARLSPLRNRHGMLVGRVAVFHDITVRKQQAEQLDYLATHDALTGLPNRRVLEDTLNRVIARARRGTASMLLFIDIDHFKEVNDTLGHHHGDQVLVTVTQFIRRALRDEDLLVRLGGDEFAALLEGITPEQALVVAERIRACIADHVFIVQNTPMHLSLSIGMRAIDGRQSFAKVLSQADTAMYQAKSAGRNRVIVFQENVLV